ncbi:hypothetical protein HYFRA_00012472 [Hymenoscyphus fraxineus]|uniref:2EXR domain-containing protein n=1 Tax=Hymenoscyphus fraxineus TaxID=746836 RepID=A0A9N9PVR6_9HELO|nr:hypothetical protein HYFRA_00012472 [Hymenoscyphus fraxineus]
MQAQFHQFPKLPPELRDDIWKIAASDPRIVKVTLRIVLRSNPIYPTAPASTRLALKGTTPPMVLVNKEAKEAYMREVKFLKQEGLGLRHKICFQPTDTLLFCGIEGRKVWKRPALTLLNRSRKISFPAENESSSSFFAGVTRLALDSAVSLPVSTISCAIGYYDLDLHLQRFPDLKKVTFVSHGCIVTENCQNSLKDMVGSDKELQFNPSGSHPVHDPFNGPPGRQLHSGVVTEYACLGYRNMSA